MTIGRRGLEFDSETIKLLNYLKEAKLPAKYIGYESTVLLIIIMVNREVEQLMDKGLIVNGARGLILMGKGFDINRQGV